MQTRIKTETDPETKLKLRRFLRSITSAHKEVAAHAALLKKFEDAVDNRGGNGCLRSMYPINNVFVKTETSVR